MTAELMARWCVTACSLSFLMGCHLPLSGEFGMQSAIKYDR